MAKKPRSKLVDKLLHSLTAQEAEHLKAEIELDDFRDNLTMGGQLMVSLTGRGAARLFELARRAKRK